MIILLSIYVIGFIAFLIHFYRLKKSERTKKKTIELLLLYQLVFYIGVTSFLAFIGFAFLPEYVAKITDWPACPFQQQMANVNFAFGVLGIMCIWYRNDFWTATVLGFSIWIFFDGIHHIVNSVQTDNYSSGNVGVPLITDIVIPVLAVTTLIFWKKVNKEN